MEFLPQNLVKEWSWRLDNGMPDHRNPLHLIELKNLLIERKFPYQFIDGLIGNLTEAKGDTSSTTFYHEVITGIIVAGGSGPFKTGADVKKYFDNGTIKAVKGSGASPVDMKKLPQVRFLEKSSIPKSSIVNDAVKVGKQIVKNLGRGKNVMWTGPTNDASRFGAGDIGATFPGYGEVGVSLKAGKGQLKNLTINSFFKTLGLPKINAEYFLTTYKKHWDAMTTDWMTLVQKNFESKLKGENKDEARSIFSKHSKKNWAEYQKEPLPAGELEILNKALGTKINKKSWSDFCRKLYEDYGSEWTSLRDAHFDNIFGEFSQKYDDQIRDGLHNLFKRQLSVGDTSLFYAAKKGQVFWFIPSEKLYDENLPPEAFISNYETKGSGSGYEFLLDVGVQTPKTGIPIGTVKVIFRFANGQMNGFPVTKSDYQLMAKDWSGLLGAFRK